MNDEAAAKSIFLKALEHEKHDDRISYLQAACGDDDELRRRVESLLQAYEQPDSLLDSTCDREMPSLERPGDAIGPYTLREIVGEGGMGTVYAAEQRRPIRRKVALKLIKPGMDSKSVLARFDAERHALSLMDHPNIAKVLDAGKTEKGRPYFVMELIQGLAITNYCDSKTMTINERLRLFAIVCQAVQHAHTKGVIHRDIKPGNVLVTEIDGSAVPKVIDFGVAKALGGSLTNLTLYTDFKTLIGTPLYMSPEQTKLSGVDVDTRSDVYSLGVLLYELLAGEVPFGKDRLRQAAFDEVCRIIREEEPPPLSQRVSSLGDTATQISRNRGTEPVKLAKSLRNELNWIVTKAMDKHRDRRYETPSALATDVNRYLANELLQAGPPTLRYRLFKFYQRNRVLTLGALLSLFVLVCVSVSAIAVSSELNRLNRDLESALHEYRSELVDHGLEAAMAGDLDSVKEIVGKAERANVPKDWRLLLEGLAKNYSEDTYRAGELLREALTINPDNVAVMASLLMTRATDSSWHQTEFEQMSVRLRNEVPDGEFRQFARLLIAWQRVYVDPRQSMDELTDLTRTRTTKWPLAQLLLAHAEAHVAIDKMDVALAKRATERATKAENILDTNPFARVVVAWTSLVEFALVEESDPVRAAELRNELGTIMERLHDADDTFACRSIRCIYYELMGDQRAMMQQFAAGRDDDWWAACRVAFFYLHGENKLALSPVQGDLPYMVMARTAQYALLASIDETEDAIRGYREIVSKSQSGISVAFAMQIPQLVGSDEYVMHEAKAFLKNHEVPDQPFYRAKTRLEYLAGYLKERQFIEAMGDSHLGLSYAHYSIALSHIYREPARARNHLELCIRERQFYTPEYYFSKALLAQHPVFVGNKNSGHVGGESADE